jgi:hypothetical protein
MSKCEAVVHPTMRSASSGQNLGQANAHSETTRHIPASSYSLGIVIGYQKSTVQDLLKDVLAGTPQRFLFAMRWRSTSPRTARAITTVARSFRLRANNAVLAACSINNLRPVGTGS